MKASPAIVSILMFAFLSGCQTEPSKSPVIPRTTVEQGRTPKPIDIEWAGTTWIQSLSASESQDFPGYRGIHLGRDGRLLLINMDEAQGDRWVLSERGGHETIDLSLLSGKPALPLTGTFYVFAESDNPNDPHMSWDAIRLVPTNEPVSDGIVLHHAEASVDIIENHWIPRKLKDSDDLKWPMNQEIHLMVLPNEEGLGVLGYGGINRFSGVITLGEEHFITGPLAITTRDGPDMEFEKHYVRLISISDRYVQVADDLFLYQKTMPTMAFEMRLFD